MVIDPPKDQGGVGTGGRQTAGRNRHLLDFFRGLSHETVSFQSHRIDFL